MLYHVPVHGDKNVCCGVRMLYLVVTIHPVHGDKNVCCGVRMLYLTILPVQLKMFVVVFACCNDTDPLYMVIKMFVVVFACCI